MLRSKPQVQLCALTLLMTLVTLSGCGSYRIQGRVVKGSISMVTLVPKDDQALELGDAVAGAEVLLFRDPGQLNRSLTASTRSRDDGTFFLPVESFGAGWMDEEWEVRAMAAGGQRAEHRLRLPSSGSDMWLLIILAPGNPGVADPSDENLWDQFQEFK